MRRNFVDILKSTKLDIEREYTKLFDLYYSVYRYEVKEHFESFFFRGTCIDLDEFGEKYGFYFDPQPQEFNIDYFINFSEYFYNMLIGLQCSNTFQYAFKNTNPSYGMELIDKIVEEIGYEKVWEGGLVIFVEKSPAAISVAESVSEELAVPILEYNHHSLKGDLTRKKTILKAMADNIESERKLLKSINVTLESQLYQLMNKFVRHDHSQTPFIATMAKGEIESTYDDIYQMWLLAKLELDNLERKNRMQELLRKING